MQMTQDWRWTRQRTKAARLVADDGQPDHAIAKAVGVHVVTLERWKQQPQFLERVTELVRSLAAAEADLWIADEHIRQQKRQELYEDMEESKKALPERAGMTRATMAKTQAGILNDAEPNKGSSINIDNRTQVLIRQVSGAEVPLG